MLNKNKDCVVTLCPPDLMKRMWGCETEERAPPIILKPDRLHTLPNKLDLYISLPKALSIRLSLESNEGYTNKTSDHHNIVFLDGLENVSFFELEDIYNHSTGIFNYIRITFLNVFNKPFCVSNNVIHASIITNNIS